MKHKKQTFKDWKIDFPISELYYNIIDLQMKYEYIKMQQSLQWKK